jgi:hypothetical protein
MKQSMCFFATLLVALSEGCYSPKVSDNNMSKSSTMSENCIGTATIDEDGTLWFKIPIESTDVNGMKADGMFPVYKTEPKYPLFLNHVGEIKPGNEVGVLPWPPELR